MELLNLKIVSKRLLLQPIAMKYQEEIFREFTEEITTYLYASPPVAISETELFLSKAMVEMQSGRNLIFVILKKDDQEFLGCSGIHKIHSQYPEFGIWLKKSAHGNSYGLEAITTLKEWAEENLDYEYLIYPVDQANNRSRRIPERLGGTIVREFVRQTSSGKVLNILEYKIPKNLSEHPKIAGNLVASSLQSEAEK